MAKLNTRDVQDFIEQEQKEAASEELQAKGTNISFNREARFTGGAQTNKTVEGLAAKEDNRVYRKKP